MTTSMASHIARRVLGAVAASGLLLVLVPVPASAADPPIAIETWIGSGTTTPPTGTFDVTAGDEILGCSAGSFTDELGEGSIERSEQLRSAEAFYLYERRRTMTCESGSMRGTLEVRFAFGEDLRSIAGGTGRWRISGGSGGFGSATGNGDFSIEYDRRVGTIAETFAGTIRMPVAPELPSTGAETAKTAVVGLGVVIVGAALVAVQRRLDARRTGQWVRAAR